MSRVFISGSSTGLGLMAAQLLAEQGHHVVIHARNERKAESALRKLPKPCAAAVGDIGTIAGAKTVAAQVNALGQFDAIIHNAAIGHQDSNETTSDGLSKTFATNTLAPYILASLIKRPRRQVFLSSGMHKDASFEYDDLQWTNRAWNGWQAYSESKLHDAMLAFACARLWPETMSNAISPGWVATRMGGAGATDDLDQGHRTQVWLATAPEAEKLTGGYYFHMEETAPNPLSRDVVLQDKLLAYCERLSGVRLA